MSSNLPPWITRLVGEQQGRVYQPAGFPPPEGDYALVLGADSPGWVMPFSVGDVFDCYQSDSPGAGSVVHFSGRFRGPSRMPALAGFEPGAGYVLADGQTLIVAIDGGANQTITFTTAQFAAIGAARSNEVRDAINSVLVGATAFLTGTELAILSDSTGRRSRVEIVGGTAVALNFQELAWKLRLLLAGTAVAERILLPGETEDLTDMAGNLAAHGDPVEIRFQVELVAL
jgi:hypothetical protein